MNFQSTSKSGLLTARVGKGMMPQLSIVNFYQEIK